MKVFLVGFWSVLLMILIAGLILGVKTHDSEIVGWSSLALIAWALVVRQIIRDRRTL
jgi:hypothetical protein